MTEPESFGTDQLGSSKAAIEGQEDDEEEMEDSDDEPELEGEGGGRVSELKPTELRTGPSVCEAVVMGSLSETLTVAFVNQSSENGRSDGRFVDYFVIKLFFFGGIFPWVMFCLLIL